MSPEFIGLVGGSALLVYSIEEISKSVQYLAGSRFRVWINSFAGNRFSGILLGIVLSLLLSSSGAVTVMLVGLANARLLTLAQVMAVTLGAGIGTTFVVHLFAFKVSSWGLLLIAFGMLMKTFSHSDRVTRVALGFFSLGLMFFSMDLVVDAGSRMEKNELFEYVINYFHDRPLVSLSIAACITAAMQSSAATIAFVMSLMEAKHGTVYEAIPWVLGANVGTTATAFFASFRDGVLGKQAAVGHLLCKLVGVILILPFMRYLGEASAALGGDVSRQIATSHTIFNVFISVLFLPFISVGVKIVRHLVPENLRGSPFAFLYLDPRTLSSPELALAQAQREILRLADTVEQMVEKSILLFEHGGQREIESVKSMDQVVDFLNKGIKLYLTRLSQKEMTPEQVQKEFELLLRTNDLENIGDIVDKNILELVRKNMKKGYVFSSEGWSEITAFHAKVVECLRISTAYFTSHDRVLAAKLLVHHQEIEDLWLELSQHHMQRLHQGIKQSLDTTSVHLDLLGNLQRIASLSVNFTRVHGIKNESAELSALS